MALLLYSPKSANCIKLLKFISDTPSMNQIVRLHNVSSMGIPPQYARQITRVPTMLTQNGKMLVGESEIQNWLESLLPARIASCDFGGKCSFSSIDGSGGDDDGDFGFSLDKCGQSLQPAMTPELLAKINQKVPSG
jgi:hypothetical protein